MQRIANFIDAGYLDHLTQETQERGNLRIDFRLLAQAMAGDLPILRTYYYDCLPYERDDASPQERQRAESKRRYFSALSRVERFEVRLGQLEFRGYDKGKPVY